MLSVQHLVKDQRVFKLVQRLAAMEEDGGKGGEAENTQSTSDDWDELTAYVSYIIIYTCMYNNFSIMIMTCHH